MPVSTLGVSSMKRHEEYYFRDGNICFLVESTTFRLHRLFFERESPYFRERLSPSTEGEPDGSLDSPYIIHDVKVDEFTKFIWVWYNPHYSFSRKGKEHWLTVLRLATQWQFQEIRNLAIRQLERLDLQPVEKIAIYKKYSVTPDLLLPSYMSLCRNEKLPSPQDAKTLSMETVLKIATARELILLSASESGCKTPTTASVPDEVAKDIIAKQFDLGVPPKEHGQANGHVPGDSLVDTEAITGKPVKKGKNSELPTVTNGLFLNGVNTTFKGKNK